MRETIGPHWGGGDAFTPLERRLTPQSPRGLGEALHTVVERRVAEWHASPAGQESLRRSQQAVAVLSEAGMRSAAKPDVPVYSSGQPYIPLIARANVQAPRSFGETVMSLRSASADVLGVDRRSAELSPLLDHSEQPISAARVETADDATAVVEVAEKVASTNGRVSRWARWFGK